MVNVRATCPDCDEVSITTYQVRLVVCTVKEWSFYSFECPKCKVTIRKPADNNVIFLLRDGGVPIEEWVVPAEVMERPQSGSLVMDDVLDFTLWLNNTDMVAADAMHNGTHVHNVNTDS